MVGPYFCAYFCTAQRLTASIPHSPDGQPRNFKNHKYSLVHAAPWDRLEISSDPREAQEKGEGDGVMRLRHASRPPTAPLRGFSLEKNPLWPTRDGEEAREGWGGDGEEAREG